MSVTRKPLSFACHFIVGDDDERKDRPHLLLVDVEECDKTFGIWFYTPKDLDSTLFNAAKFGRFPRAIAPDVSFAGDAAWRNFHSKKHKQETTGRDADPAGAGGVTDEAGGPGRVIEVVELRLPLPWWMRLNGVSWALLAGLSVTGILIAVAAAVGRVVGG